MKNSTELKYIVYKPLPDNMKDEFMNHLINTGHKESTILEVEEMLKSGCYLIICGFLNEKIVAHISLKIQLIRIPILAPSAKIPSDFVFMEEKEIFVYTFAVEKLLRNKGIGTRLQKEAIKTGIENRYYQMRSWSSLDKKQNYRIKHKLGFCIVPGWTYVERLNEWFEGVYFIKKL